METSRDRKIISGDRRITSRSIFGNFHRPSIARKQARVSRAGRPLRLSSPSRFFPDNKKKGAIEESRKGSRGKTREGRKTRTGGDHGSGDRRVIVPRKMSARYSIDELARRSGAKRLDSSFPFSLDDDGDDASVWPVQTTYIYYNWRSLVRSLSSSLSISF